MSAENREIRHDDNSFKGPSQTARSARPIAPASAGGRRGDRRDSSASAPRRPSSGNAEAATPTLRLLMWQPYAIKETIAEFETKTGAKLLAHLLRRQFRSLQQDEGRRHQGFRHRPGRRLLAAALFPPGPDPGASITARSPNMANVFPEFLPPNFPLLADETGATQGRGAELLGRLWHHRQYQPQIAPGGYRLDRAAAEREVRGPFLDRIRASKRTSR